MGRRDDRDYSEVRFNPSVVRQCNHFALSPYTARSQVWVREMVRWLLYQDVNLNKGVRYVITKRGHQRE